jgi:hypothetical protein
LTDDDSDGEAPPVIKVEKVENLLKLFESNDENIKKV